MKLSEQQIQNLTNDFEQGWDDKRLNKADFTWETAALQLLPTHLENALRLRANEEGTSELSIMRDALEAYLKPA
ncbi:hypothetical protein RQN30_08575 [Arcanobacterium hippocoleae]